MSLYNKGTKIDFYVKQYHLSVFATLSNTYKPHDIKKNDDSDNVIFFWNVPVSPEDPKQNLIVKGT